MEKTKIIIDTDIGDDVDDAFALGFALKCPELDVVGITTVFKNTAQRAAIVRAELAAFGRTSIPVYTGIDVPLCGRASTFAYETTEADGKPHIAAYDDDMPAVPTDVGAAEYLLDAADSSSGQITLVAIGPLTNVAEAFRKRPDSFRKFKRLVIMGGSSYNWKEWNIMCDPEAARTVLNSGVPIRLVGVDCTLKCEMTEKYLRALENLPGASGAFLKKMFAVWKRYNPRVSQMHDALAVGEIFGDFCRYEPRRIAVPLEAELRGYTISVPDDTLPEIEMAVGVDAERLMDTLFDRLAQ